MSKRKKTPAYYKELRSQLKYVVTFGPYGFPKTIRALIRQFHRETLAYQRAKLFRD